MTQPDIVCGHLSADFDGGNRMTNSFAAAVLGYAFPAEHENEVIAGVERARGVDGRTVLVVAQHNDQSYQSAYEQEVLS